MQFLEFLKISDGWITTIVIYGLLLALVVTLVLKRERISSFLGQVKGELRKASWPWESDPKIKGLRKYKELVDSTLVVLVAMVLLAGFVQFWDFLHVLIVGFFTGLGN